MKFPQRASPTLWESLALGVGRHLVPTSEPPDPPGSLQLPQGRTPGLAEKSKAMLSCLLPRTSSPGPVKTSSTACKADARQAPSGGALRHTALGCVEDSANLPSVSDRAPLGTVRETPPPRGCLNKQKVKVDK